MISNFLQYYNLFAKTRLSQSGDVGEEKVSSFKILKHLSGLSLRQKIAGFQPAKAYKQSDKYSFYCIAATILMLFLTVILFTIYLPKLPYKIPMFYSLPWGTPQLVNLSQFFILPLILMLISLLNLIISWQLHPSQIIFKRIVNFGTAIIAFLVLITSFKIIHIFV